MKTKKLALLTILMAMNIAISFVFVPVGENLRIYFTFIITMMVAANFSLSVCLIHAIIEDLLSFFLFPTGPFFIGYTLSAVLSIFIYWLFLHKKVDIKNVIFARATVNIFVNIGLGSLWSSILYSNGFIYYAAKSIFKNLALLPIEILIFMAIYKLVQPLFDKYKNSSFN